MLLKTRIKSFLERIRLRLADHENPHSLISYVRWQRWKLFVKLFLKDNSKKLSILDVGGVASYWKQFPVPPSVRIICLNLSIREIATLRSTEKGTRFLHVQWVVRDACYLPFANHSFDIVHSNSVMEHVGAFANQEQMAQEIRRVGKSYFIQIPNFSFPVEPHYGFPCFNYLPWRMKYWIARYWPLVSWVRKAGGRKELVAEINKIRLLKKRELRGFFPQAHIQPERTPFGLTFSWLVIYRDREKL